VLRLPDAETYFIKYLGITTLYLNSILLKSRKVDIFPTGSTIRGDKIESIYYSDVVGKFLVGESQTHITFSADHLFYHFKSGRAGLQNVNIAEQGGKLIGLMGASGSENRRCSTFLTELKNLRVDVSSSTELIFTFSHTRFTALSVTSLRMTFLLKTSQYTKIFIMQPGCVSVTIPKTTLINWLNSAA
jgi:hypothetical protein